MAIDRRDYPVLFRMLFSFLVFGLCVFILFDKDFSSDYVKWAFGTIGVLLGYWLK